MSKTYRSSGFVFLWVGTLLFILAVGYVLRVHLSGIVITCGIVLIALFGLISAPFVGAKVSVDDEGITQQVLRRRSVKWGEIIWWERVHDPGSDGPDTISIKTCSDTLTLYHNCIYGKRLDEIEALLRGNVPVQNAPAPKDNTND